MKSAEAARLLALTIIHFALLRSKLQDNSKSKLFLQSPAILCRTTISQISTIEYESAEFVVSDR